MQVEMQVRQAPPVGGVSYIHRAEAQSLSPRFGKDLLMLHDTIYSLIAATTTTSLSTARRKLLYFSLLLCIIMTSGCLLVSLKSV